MDKTSAEIYSGQSDSIRYQYGSTVEEFRKIDDSRREICKLYDQIMTACGVMKGIDDPFIRDAVDRRLVDRIALLGRMIECVKRRDEKRADGTSYLVYKRSYQIADGKLLKTTMLGELARKYADEKKEKDPDSIYFVVRKKKDGSLRCIYRLE